MKGVRLVFGVPECPELFLAYVTVEFLFETLHGLEIGFLLLWCDRWEQPFNVIVAATLGG